MALERLQKIIAAAGLCSRRAAEELITAGRVRVNGPAVTELGAKAVPLEGVDGGGEQARADELVEPAHDHGDATPLAVGRSLELGHQSARR